MSAETLPEEAGYGWEEFDLRQKVLKLDELRRRESAAQAAYAREEMAFRQRVLDVIREKEAAEAERKALDAAIREEAREEFLRYGDKTPVPGVTVREVKRLRYDEEEALAWAREWNPNCLKLDKARFEKVGKALDFVQEVKEPVIAIESNLFSVYGGESALPFVVEEGGE